MTMARIFDVRIAGLTIRIHARLALTERFFADYIVHEEIEPDFCIYLPEGFIGDETEEELELHRALARQLSLFDRLLMHGAAIEYGGNGYLFIAPSGTGKSTHIRLWRRTLGERVGIVNGDKPILHVDQKEILVCGTPWAGKEGWQRNVSVPLKGICLVKRGKNAIRRVEFTAYAEEVLRQVYIPEDGDLRIRTIDLLGQVLTHVPLYELSCDMTEEAVQIAFEGLTGETY